MAQIYTSNGSLIVETTIWSGDRRNVKNADGTCESFYRVNGQPKFRKTGWGKRAAAEFLSAIAKAKAELAA